MTDGVALLQRFQDLLTRLETLLPTPTREPDWSAHAFRWRGAAGLQVISHPHRVRLDDLRHIDRQRDLLLRNTRQFLAGVPANNALLWGARGTGKSSLIKSLLDAHGADGLRLIEVAPQDLQDLPDIVEQLYQRPERFVLFTDDLSFTANDPSYTALKALLDGSLTNLPDNVLIYATSNRRHLLPEYQSDNLDTRLTDAELHPGESVEEKISLSERFGLWLAFHSFDQVQYLDLVTHWLDRLGATTAKDDANCYQAALQYARRRGSKSGRIAWQFARDWVGHQALLASR